jgi:hypothetical protein
MRKDFYFGPRMGLKAVKRASKATGVSENIVFVEAFTRSDNRMTNHFMKFITSEVM